MTSAAAPSELTATRRFALTVGLLATANFVIVTTEFVMVGLLPETARDYGVPLEAAGRLVTWFALGAALGGPPLAMLAARCGVRPALLAATFVTAMGNIVAALEPSLAVLSIVRAVQGMALPAFVSVASVAAAELAGPRRRGWAISLVNGGVVAATVVGVPAGMAMADRFAWPTTFAVLALLGIASMAALAVILPRVAPVTPPSRRAELRLLGTPGFLAHLLLSAILFTAMFTAYTYLPALLVAIDRLDATAAAWAMASFGLAGVLGNWLAGRTVDRGPLVATASVALVLGLVLVSVRPAAATPLTLFVVLGVWGAAHAAAFACCQVRVMTAGLVAPAFALSLNISVCNLGIALGAGFGGLAVSRYGVEAIGETGAVLAAAAFVLAVVLIVGSQVKRR